MFKAKCDFWGIEPSVSNIRVLGQTSQEMKLYAIDSGRISFTLSYLELYAYPSYFPRGRQ
jgi:hypothetical protein